MSEPANINRDQLIVARLIGGPRWHSRGSLLHLVPETTDSDARSRALCGTKPSGRSHGWSPQPEGIAPTCQRCIARRDQ